MEPLMNAPQWFLERGDSTELIGLLNVNYNDPIVILNRFTYSIGKRYLAIFITSTGACIRTYKNPANIKIKNRFIQVRCVYDTQDDQYISI
jgi:hypothetical protein